MTVVLTILKREISCSRSAEGQQEECATGEVDNRRTAGGVEDMVRSRGQREESRTAGGFEDSGGGDGEHLEIK